MRAESHAGAVAAAPPLRYEEVVVGGLKTACLSRNGLVRTMVEDCMAARGNARRLPRLIFTTNGHSIALAATDPGFRRQLEAADLLHADGQPAVFASRFTRTPIPERTATTDFIHDAAKAAQGAGLRFYLLGATEEINARAAWELLRLYPDLKIVGRRNGYFAPSDESAICDRINASGADVVWVGLGVPREMGFSIRNKHRLNAGWIVTCGGCFNFLAGDYARAPKWMQAAGMEWLHRLLREPRRLFMRYAVTNPMALFLLLTRTHSLPRRAAADPVLAPEMP